MRNGPEPSGPHAPVPLRSRAWTLGIPILATALVTVTMLTSGAGLDDRYLSVNWQLIDLPVLRDDPLGSVWYLHVQPPLFNLVVGSVMRWSPTPPIGTLFAGYVACLGLTGALLADLLARWRVPAIAAGVLGGLAVTLPGPLSTIVGGSYEVPVAALLLVALSLAHRHLERPRPGLLVGISLALTAVTMTRSLFHPLWVVGLLVVLAVARPLDRRAVAAALAIPILVTGGWMAKNQVVVEEPTLSSWVGFNLQRGVTAPMDRTDVRRAVVAGEVTPLALEKPFSSLSEYDEADGCVPDDRHPALSAPLKEGVAVEVPNFNNTCYLPLYRESSDNASTLLRKDPGRYLSTRRAALLTAFRTFELGVDDPEPTLAGPSRPHRTWIDSLWSTALVPTTVSIDLEDWNIPLLGVDRMDFEISLTLLLGYLVVTGRGLLALIRLVRAGWRDRATRWSADEVTWAIVLSIATIAVVLAGLVEFGENDRFRATIDPLLVALPAGLAVRAVADRLRPRGNTVGAAAGPGPEIDGTDDGAGADDVRAPAPAG